MNKNKQGIIVVAILTVILLSAIIMIVRFETKVQKDDEKNLPEHRIEENVDSKKQK